MLKEKNDKSFALQLQNKTTFSAMIEQSQVLGLILSLTDIIFIQNPDNDSRKADATAVSSIPVAKWFISLNYYPILIIKVV